MNSWKTTAAGVGTILVALGSAITALFDADPLTVPDWTAVIAALIVGIGLVAARDNGVTSEQSGAK